MNNERFFTQREFIKIIEEQEMMNILTEFKPQLDNILDMRDEFIEQVEKLYEMGVEIINSNLFESWAGMFDSRINALAEKYSIDPKDLSYMLYELDYIDTRSTFDLIKWWRNIQELDG